MDREFLLALLVGMITSATVVCCGWLPARAPSAHDAGADAERRAWRRLLLPLAPMALGLAFLLGWALVEPDDAEPATRAAWAPFAFVAIVCLRAWVRSALALTAAGASSTRVPAAVGLLRPCVVVPAELAEVFSEDEHAAVVAHEGAHVEHRDPLRIWLAQLAADLQWPWPAAAARLSRWMEALEWARDDEARLRGADGEALASALLVTVRRCTAARRSYAVAALTGN